MVGDEDNVGDGDGVRDEDNIGDGDGIRDRDDVGDGDNVRGDDRDDDRDDVKHDILGWFRGEFDREKEALMVSVSPPGSTGSILRRQWHKSCGC